MGRRLPQQKELMLKNVDKIIEEVMRLEDYKNKDEVFAQYPKLAQWWAQEYSAYGDAQEKTNTTAGGYDRQSRR
jgi:hypothetical protein